MSARTGPLRWAGTACKLAFVEHGKLDRITVNPLVCGGQPTIRGLRIPVSLVLRHLAAGQTPEQVVGEYPELEVEDCRQALRYAAWLASGRAIDLPAA